jgi:hypothetical protein
VREAWSWLWTVVGSVVAGLVILGVILWYFTVYDTAKGKCERGDPDACVIWQAQQPHP